MESFSLPGKMYLHDTSLNMSEDSYQSDARLTLGGLQARNMSVLTENMLYHIVCHVWSDFRQ